MSLTDHQRRALGVFGLTGEATAYALTLELGERDERTLASLRRRGLVRQVDTVRGERRRYELTDDGRQLARKLFDPEVSR